MNYDVPIHVFFSSLLKLQCDATSAVGAAIVRPGENDQIAIAASHPPIAPNTAPPMWLSTAANILKRMPWPEAKTLRLIDSNNTSNDATPNAFVFMPVPHMQNDKALAIYPLIRKSGSDPAAAMVALEACFAHVATYFSMRSLQQRERDVQGLTTILQLQMRANEHANFRTAAIAFCNEVSTRYKLERASLGLISGNEIRLRSMSQTEHINRRMNLVQRIEAAMEECFDQDCELMYPIPEQTPLAVRMTQQLAQEFGPSTVCSIPMRRQGKVEGVLTLERDQQQLFSPEELREIRILLDLASPRLLERYDEDRWFGARLATKSRRALSAVIGPQYTWIKVAAVALLAVLIFMIFVKGPDRIDADFKIETQVRQIVPAPYAGFIDQVYVEPGDPVTANQTVLATLDTSELLAEQAKLVAQLETHEKEADIARHEGKEAEVQMAQARAKQTRSDMQAVKLKLARSKLISSITGIVLEGDLKDQLGAPVSRGDVLFQVAPPESMVGELYIPDNRISDLQVGHEGQLATSSHPDQPIDFVVESIFPMAEVIDQKNVFKVKVRLQNIPNWVRPGVEGLAKVDVGRKPYGVLWTREAWNWVRMQLWI